MGEALQKMQDDATANPGMLFVQLGGQLWAKKAGTADKSCADCHGSAGTSMKGVAARYPAIPKGSDAPVDLEGRIEFCRTENQKAERWTRRIASCWRSRPMLPISRTACRSRRRRPTPGCLWRPGRR